MWLTSFTYRSFTKYFLKLVSSLSTQGNIRFFPNFSPLGAQTPSGVLRLWKTMPRCYFSTMFSFPFLPRQAVAGVFSRRSLKPTVHRERGCPGRRHCGQGVQAEPVEETRETPGMAFPSLCSEESLQCGLPRGLENPRTQAELCYGQGELQ